ncbi:MAG: class I SAM-dependent methyltransferase, partial [Bacteroidetes bacterium]
MTQWIEDWFGSEYYSLLYKHRDFNEARLFLDNLISFLKITSESRILDCGCGKGRHSIYLSEKGFEVTGLDISEKNIIESKKTEKSNLVFFTHDLCNLFRTNYYDVALSLFTSFGYFE